VDREANNAGRFSEGWQHLKAVCKKLIEVRMQLVPYLYAAFVRYHLEGVPPVRALVMDYPNDVKAWTIDDEYLLGEDLLVAPVFVEQKQRLVYLPEGEWFDFWTGVKTSGSQSISVTPALDQIPVFVRSGALLPLAQPTLHTAAPEAFHLTVHAYGDNNRRFTLYEDDGGPHPNFTRANLTWDNDQTSGKLERSSRSSGPEYSVIGWQRLT
jgi:alpha-D-xyloside xylohydrolase